MNFNSVVKAENSINKGLVSLANSDHSQYTNYPVEIPKNYFISIQDTFQNPVISKQPKKKKLESSNDYEQSRELHIMENSFVKTYIDDKKVEKQ